MPDAIIDKTLNLNYITNTLFSAYLTNKVTHDLAPFGDVATLCVYRIYITIYCISFVGFLNGFKRPSWAKYRSIICGWFVYIVCVYYVDVYSRFRK